MCILVVYCKCTCRERPGEVDWITTVFDSADFNAISPMTVRKHATIGKGSIGTLLGVSFDGVGKLIYTVSFGVKVARFRQPGCICAYCSAVSVHLQQVNTIVTDSHLYL